MEIDDVMNCEVFLAIMHYRIRSVNGLALLSSSNSSSRCGRSMMRAHQAYATSSQLFTNRLSAAACIRRVSAVRSAA